MNQRIGIIGCGQMARALARGFINAKKAPMENLLASDPSDDARRSFSAKIGCETVKENHEVVKRSSVVVLAVKPDVAKDVLREVRNSVTGDHLFISIVTGLSLMKMVEDLGSERRLARVMPNTPVLVGAGACGLAIGGAATESDAEYVVDLFRSMGVAYRIAEHLMDAVTGLSGSGPAYVYQIIEALSDGGVRTGLPRVVATALAAQTVFGAAKMVLETGKHPGELKDMVTSPGGTTIAGLSVMEGFGVRAAMIEAVAAATKRARELAEG